MIQISPIEPGVGPGSSLAGAGEGAGSPKVGGTESRRSDPLKPAQGNPTETPVRRLHKAGLDSGKRRKVGDFSKPFSAHTPTKTGLRNLQDRNLDPVNQRKDEAVEKDVAGGKVVGEENSGFKVGEKQDDRSKKLARMDVEDTREDAAGTGPEKTGQDCSNVPEKYPGVGQDRSVLISTMMQLLNRAPRYKSNLP